jgi:oligopeptide transport system permease protein
VFWAVLIGTVSGVLAALRKNTWIDYLSMSFSMAGICVPSFVMGPILVLIFAIFLGVLPFPGWDSALHKILPSITLGGGLSAYVARLARSGMLEILNQDYIRTARAKGVPEKTIILKHALRGGILLVIAFIGPAIAALLSGSFVVETVFDIPGLGRNFVQSAFNRDYTMILGMTVFFCVLVIFFNLVTDVIMVLLNPKLSFDEGKR